jgi:AcrR family transcriptional regulator
MRKEPKQKRSRETVEAVLEATAHILGRRGWAKLNTNEVAEVAGVSIGSLYQYFPNKLALIEAARRRHFDDVLSRLRVARDRSLTHAERIDRVVQGMIDLHSRNPAVHHALLEETPRSPASKEAHDTFEAEYLKLYEALIPRRTARDIAAQVLSSAIAGVVHDAARRGTLNSSALKCELVRLVSAYQGSITIGARQ